MYYITGNKNLGEYYAQLDGISPTKVAYSLNRKDPILWSNVLVPG